MSSSSVCQGLQSCLEPGLMEPRVLNLKLAPTRSNLSPSPEFPSSMRSSSSSFFSILESDQNVKESKSGWSFLQSVENVYVHPASKLSSSKVSAESLDLCTESLGCESGSRNAGDNSNGDDMSLFSPESRSSYAVKRNSETESKSWNRVGRSFPPPLTSMTELGGFQVRSHREDGRLILEAVTSSSPKPYFQAERENGRLRLRLFESVSSCCCDDDDKDGEACVEEEAEVVEVLEEYVGCGGEDEMEMTKFARPSRCMENGNRDIFGDGYFELPSRSLCL